MDTPLLFEQYLFGPRSAPATSREAAPTEDTPATSRKAGLPEIAPVDDTQAPAHSDDPAPVDATPATISPVDVADNTPAAEVTPAAAIAPSEDHPESAAAIPNKSTPPSAALDLFGFPIDTTATPASRRAERNRAAAEKKAAADDLKALRARAKAEAARAAEERKATQAAARAERAAKKAEKERLANMLPADISTGQFAGPEQLPAALADLESAKEVSLDLETTALTPWAKVEAPGSATKMGNGVTTRAYAKAYRTEFNRTPRPRILSFRTRPCASNQSWAFDLDTLSPEQKKTLVGALHDKIWVGHNLAFDLMWLRTIVPAVTPRAWIDTMMLSTTHVPEFEFAVRDLFNSVEVPDYLCADHSGVASGWRLPAVLCDGSPARAAMQVMLAQRDARQRTRSDDEPSRSLPLDFLSVALLGEKLDKAYQKPHNWMPAVLTVGHFDYCVGDITQPPRIARRLFGLPENVSTNTLLLAIKERPGYTAYATFMRAAWRLVQMQSNGLYFDPTATAEYIKKHTADAESALAALLADMPDLEPHRADLLDPDKGLTDDLKNAFANGLARLTGIAPERTETGAPKLDAKSLKMQYRDLPALSHYTNLSGALKRVAMARAYAAQTDDNGRLHSMVSIATVTGRTASQEPNLQNAPRGQDFRAIFAAPAGKKIIAVDYSAIEMRIAAALATRAYRDFRAIIDLADAGKKSQYESRARALGLHWFLGTPEKPNKDGTLSAIDAILYLLRNGSTHPDALIESGPRPAVGDPIEKWRDHYAGALYAVIAKMHAAGAFQPDPKNDRLALADVFARGLDPHLITALATESAAGRFDLSGATPTEFVARLDHAEQEALKKQLKGPRQSAKAQNFGLLYGMQSAKLYTYGITNYGLNWTPEEAEFAALSWFDLYPEISLWHIITRSQKTKLFINTTEQRKLFRASTLSGRPVCSDKLPSALNFQDQGTGAEIALSALVDMPAHLVAELVNFVHDEFVFEVPADLAEHREREIIDVMIAAADKLLNEKWGVPTLAEASTGDFWIH